MCLLPLFCMLIPLKCQKESACAFRHWGRKKKITSDMYIKYSITANSVSTIIPELMKTLECDMISSTILNCFLKTGFKLMLN